MDIKEIYDREWKELNPKKITLNLNRWPRNRHEASLKFLRIKDGLNILDAGCGCGEILRDLTIKTKNVYAIDISKNCINKLKRKIKSNLKTHVGNIEKGTPYKDNFFDIIISSDVIEHSVNRYEFIKELSRILKKGGILVLTTPNLAKIRNRIKLLFGRYPATSQIENEGYGNFDYLYDGGHLHYFTFNTLKILLQGSGFKIEKRFGCGRFGKFHNFFPQLMSGQIVMISRKL